MPPVVAFFLIMLFTRRSKPVSDVIAVGAIMISWLVSLVVFVRAVSTEHLAEHPIHSAVDWLPTGVTTFQVGVLVDPLGATVLFFVPLVCMLIIFYSTGYYKHIAYYTGDEEKGYEKVHRDNLKPRFMAFLSLFAAGMLTLVVADNLLLLFVGWEIMGLCSYLLIGFWYDKRYPNQPDRMNPMRAGVKAFMTTRVGDMFMLLGIVYLYSQTDTLSFVAIMRDEHVLEGLMNPSFIGGLTVANLVGLLLFAGTVGKSAQFPLHVWLPDAMEGPTPVSAMIHAAAMVSAGVYMIIRMFPILSLGWHHGGHLTAPMIAMSAIGAFTALFAATIALTMRDVKAVLAYSTISQLGYMVAALGIGAYIAATFHLVTHAFFKALLFLGSGSIIHGVEHGEEHAHEHGEHFPQDFDPQDMFNMGGLWKKMPITAWTFLIGGLALSGFPFFTAGFWSKDEILADAWANNSLVFWALAVAAFLTAFYTMRQIGLTFAGKSRTAASEHASENEWKMTLPLIILAVFAIGAGYVGVHESFPVLGGLGNPFHHFVGETLLEHPETIPLDWTPLIISIIAALSGLGLGALIYVLNPLEEGQEDPLRKVLGPIYTLLENKYYIDELYGYLFIRPARWFAETFAYEWVDRGLIDGTLHGIARTVEWLSFRNKDFDTYVVNAAGDSVATGIGGFGRAFRRVQSGQVQQYLVFVTGGVVLLALLFVWLIFLR
jgi:NADH-quinone oxidoreductase subunit L